MKNVSLESLVERCLAALPSELAQFRESFRQHLSATLSSALPEMDLVSREEYDVQTRLLSRTREQLDQLECRIAKLGKL